MKLKTGQPTNNTRAQTELATHLLTRFLKKDIAYCYFPRGTDPRAFATLFTRFYSLETWL